jgi:hypothetical protein
MICTKMPDLTDSYCMSKLRYASLETIKKAIDSGVIVYWRHDSHVVTRNFTKKYNIQAKLSPEKVLIVSLRRTINMYGLEGFYSHEEIRNLDRCPCNFINSKDVIHPPLLD